MRAARRVSARCYSTEKQHLLPLPAEDFELAEVSFPTVDQAGCAKVRTNFYSVPLKAGSVVEARVYSSVVEFRQDGVRVAQHERSYERAQQILDLEHYLEVLERKPGALRGSKPLAQWRAQGRWPESYDRLWELMNEKAWTPGWNAIHGCAHPHGPRVRLRQAGNVGRASDGAGLYGCGCHPSSPDERRASARGRDDDRDRSTGCLRTSAAHDGRV